MLQGNIRADLDLPGWIIGPATRLLDYAAEETHLTGLLHRALGSLTIQETFLRDARKKLVASGIPTAPIDTLLVDQPAIEKEARQILDADLHPINSHALIGLWSAVEVAIEDTICLIVMKDSAALTILRKAGVPLANRLLQPIEESDARRLYSRFEREKRKTLPVGKAYCEMLSALDVPIAPEIDILATLTEINYVRNCILHRGGFTDGRVEVEAPVLAIQAGTKIWVTRALYLRYFDAVGKFSVQLIEAVVASKYSPK